jgi:hypothetical protein
MGAIKIRTTDDCARYGCDIGVSCCSCGRMAVYDTAAWRARIGRSLDMTISPFRCRCGSRLIIVRPVNQCERPDPLPPRRAPLVPLYVKVPKRRQR